jgi:membrane protease YdiL (CAAX protease family)
MSTQAPNSLTVVRLLLAASWRRAVGRRRRARDLFANRAGKQTINWGIGGYLLTLLLVAVVHALAAVALIVAVYTGAQSDQQRSSALVVDAWFIHQVAATEGQVAAPWQLNRAFATEAARLAARQGGDPAQIEARLRQAVATSGTANLLARITILSSLRRLPPLGGMAELLGGLVLLVWAVMLVFQGEGLELDVQRRRHPMWEWLFSHPVSPAAVFLAEMLSPIAANPIYLAAPLFPAVVYGVAYRGAPAGCLAAVLIGVPLAVCLACLGKALEIAVTLRISARSRGAVIGLMSWLGYTLMMLFLVVAPVERDVFAALARQLSPLGALPWPVLGAFLGATDGGLSFPRGVAAGWIAAALVTAGSVWFSVWAARRGLVSAQRDIAPSRLPVPRSVAGFGTRALYRKELLWFLRDRSALVQAVLIPLTLAGWQLFNLRLVLAHAQAAWTGLATAAVLFGSYFLFVLGPKSLASEGAALWLTLTWPHGLEQLLKAKAWLWTALATALVAPVLLAAAVLSPADAWKVVLVGIAWFLFARSMAAKGVTLATTTSDSGEIQKIPTGRRWAAQLGVLPFVIGVFTQQWNLVLTGLLYSVMTATALWQNFRARLPYLYDPWSEPLPQAPTLMHAMISISAMVEIAALLNGLARAFAPSRAAIAMAAIYGACALGVSVYLAVFLHNRDVPQSRIWRWPAARPSLAPAIAVAAAAGLFLGALALGYTSLLHRIPSIARAMDQSSVQIASTPNLRVSLVVLAVLMAPVAEEFLFRGLLFRALDREWGREWGGWRAIAGSAAFFASYHPVLSWLPVGLLGATNAVLFKKTGRLELCVLTHLTYNAVVLHALF